MIPVSLPPPVSPPAIIHDFPVVDQLRLLVAPISHSDVYPPSVPPYVCLPQCTSTDAETSPSGEPRLRKDQFYVYVIHANGEVEMCVGSHQAIPGAPYATVVTPPATEVDAVAVKANAAKAASETGEAVEEGEEVDDPELTQ
eukprot:1376088-Pleurochrysis_carterae.AAC.1